MNKTESVHNIHCTVQPKLHSLYTEHYEVWISCQLKLGCFLFRWKLVTRILFCMLCCTFILTPGIKKPISASYKAFEVVQS